ncbi:MAG TPA: xanthine dehydrogenase family protein subunit M [Sinorhizobium sp.]|nr:xanthine dehydrogenase family protein subunit M [Sinorhizobium sp.]
MKPAPFEYFAPASIEEALGLLQEHGEEAKVIAGGQSLVPMMNFRLVRPACLIDINRIGGLSYITEQGGELRIGAMTRQRALEESPLLREKNGLLVEAARLIGHPATRSRGTVGGSVVHADPTAELPVALSVLDGSIEVAGPGGSRTIGWRDLFLSYFTTTLEPGEICTEVRVPVLPSGAGWAFEEFTRRHGDFAIVGVAAVVELTPEGRCDGARLALAGGAPTPLRAEAAENFLQGKEMNDAVVAEAGQLAAGQVEAESDLHASGEYRRHLAAVMTRRALTKALRRAGRGGQG